MRRFVIVMTLAVVTVAPLAATLSTAETRRIQDAATVLNEITVSPEKGIPLDLWNRAACVMVRVPISTTPTARCWSSSI